VHDDYQATLGLRFLHACGDFLLSNILQTFVKRQIDVGPTRLIARISSHHLHCAACGVTLQRDLVRCAREFAIVQVFEPAQPCTIDPHKAEYLPGEVTLWIETSRLLQDLYTADVELLHPLANLRRQLARQPDKC
jgi:hypothetical protein